MYDQPLFTKDVFKTKRFTIRFEALPEWDIDLSWDETGETIRDIENYTLTVFCAKVSVLLDGREIATNYLGQCIYRSIEEFITEYRNDYFKDMVLETIQEARKEVLALEPLPYIREVA